MDLFLIRSGQHSIHAWKMLDDRAALRMECEILFVLDDMADGKGLNTKDLFELLDDTVTSARQRGFQKVKRATNGFVGKKPPRRSGPSPPNGQRRQRASRFTSNDSHSVN